MCAKPFSDISGRSYRYSGLFYHVCALVAMATLVNDIFVTLDSSALSMPVLLVLDVISVLQC